MIPKETEEEIQKALQRGVSVLYKPPPLSLDDWAEQNFYLSAESSYVEGRWEAFPYQKAMLGCISNDDIREIVFLKSARIGATKCMLASIAYFAEHKKRNQVIYQPVDDDAESFCKTEIEPMIRDIACVREIFPFIGAKHKRNTLQYKGFIGSSLHILGGKSAKNYRRISVDCVYMDELDGFDHDIEMEGSPVALAAKRTEGATFPKIVLGSTPKIKGASMIEDRYEACEAFVKFMIPCPHCGEVQALEWGGKDFDYGFKWENDDPNTVAYKCVGCGDTFGQEDYLNTWDKGKWYTDKGEYLTNSGELMSPKGKLLTTPRSVGFRVWTAYSPMTEWSKLVREFLDAKGNPRKLKGFVNLTLGETWEEDTGAKMEADSIMERREKYPHIIPDGVKMLTIGADCQDDRVEWAVAGWGDNEESWQIDYQVLFGDLATDEFWVTLYNKMRTPYGGHHAKLCAIDSGGHFTDQVYEFCRKAGAMWAIPCKGSSVAGKPIANFPAKKNKDGVYFTIVGTDTTKDLMYHRLALEEHGEGFCHFPEAEWCNPNYFKQLTAESRKPVYSKSGQLTFAWSCTNGVRNEVWDCILLALVAIRILQQRYGVLLQQLPSIGGGDNEDDEVLTIKEDDAVKPPPPPPVPIQPVRRVRRRMISSGVDF